MQFSLYILNIQDVANRIKIVLFYIVILFCISMFAYWFYFVIILAVPKAIEKNAAIASYESVTKYEGKD